MTGVGRAAAGPNIALIKYWGNRGDPSLRLAANGSISLTLDTLSTEVQVSFQEGLRADTLQVNGQPAGGDRLTRAQSFMDQVRRLTHEPRFASIDSRSNFPMGAGIASSASAFAALALAAVQAAGKRLRPSELSRLARLGSGSACRSVYGGYVEWIATAEDATSQAEPLQPPEHWPLVDLIALIDESHKPVGSTEGHALAATSPLQAARLADTPRRLDACRQALRLRDFAALAEIVELDCNLMHAVMLTSTPRLVYWQPATLALIHRITRMRQSGLNVCYTIDAGPTVHCLSEPSCAGEATAALEAVEGVRRVLRASPGPGVRLLAADGQALDRP
jgi:diphosphomevalonate decarboxylase